MSQVDTNPFALSDTNKRYHTYDYYLRKRFGHKVAKIPLDCGLSCPNIDGTVGFGGCIYCSGGSSWGQTRSVLPLEEQYKKGIAIMNAKWQTNEYIPYLQAYTNTHTSPENLEKILDQVSNFHGAVMIDVATRADCLDNQKIEVINRISKKIPITVELGLQTSNDETAKRINRCHSLEVFKDAFCRLRQGAPSVKIGIHIINGLPGENDEDMKNTATCVQKLHPDLLKIHLLHVIKGTPLATLYELGRYTPLEKDEYVKIVCDQLEIMPPDVVIERVTGDGLADLLLAPLWSKKKVSVINEIDKELVKRDTCQGIFYKNDNFTKI